MFRRLAASIAHQWYLWLLGWIALAGVARFYAPRWEQVAVDNDAALLAESMPSRIALRQFQTAFPESNSASNIVLVLHRANSQGQFLQADKDLIAKVLEPRLREAIPQLDAAPAGNSDSPFATSETKQSPVGPVLRLRTPNALGVGELLISSDREALLMVLEMAHGPLSHVNAATIRTVQQTVADVRGQLPAGLQLDITGSAVVGYDQNRAEAKSARSTELLTVVLVIILLLLIYRAPVLAIIPLMTVALAVWTAVSLLALLAKANLVGLFAGIQVYVTVLSYGAGVDFSLFLIARFKEERDRGLNEVEAIEEAVTQVATTITASAFTVICGLGMLAFAEFGKFRDAGIAIAFGLMVVWLAALTFCPAFLRLAGRWAFWPARANPQATDSETIRKVVDDPCGKVEPRSIRDGWAWVIGMVACRPWRALIVTMTCMLPFAAVALATRNQVNYGLISNLPSSALSIAGTKALERHFPLGTMGPTSILVVNPNQDFRGPAGREWIKSLTAKLRGQESELSIADVRTFTSPLGRITDQASARKELTPEAADEMAQEYYTSSMGERAAVATRIDISFRGGPFDAATVKAMESVLRVIAADLPPEANLYATGITATIRDMQTVMQRDRYRIERLVLLAVLIILILLLRQLVVPLYLLFSVLLSYLATLGVTYLVFWGLTGSEFAGIDWKVPIFLFAILIAVGEDYNIFLVARVSEEQKKHGARRGIIEALVRTGPIISSCGIIMAGTFASLLSASLVEMRQLGFALALGVLLDTYVVRPILVPAFLLLYQTKLRSKEGQGRVGNMSEARGVLEKTQ